MCIMSGETDQRRGVEIGICVCARVGFGGAGGRSRLPREHAHGDRKKRIGRARQKVEVENDGSSFDSGTT